MTYHPTMLIACLLLLAMLESSESEECPARYVKLSAHHSYCLARNPSCEIFSFGITGKQEKEEILNIHNSLRSKIAMGLINQQGEATTDHKPQNYPKAADMMEMVWDDELSAIAQKWVEQCDFKHDCRECRGTPEYSVGQNIAYIQFSCPKGDCAEADGHHHRNWTKRIEEFFSEIVDAPKSVVKSFRKAGKPIGHFTQIIWASSWKIGCGYVSHKASKGLRQFYGCNYAPTGNIIEAPIYTEGEPCSKCPSNSCCGEKCSPPALPGLCRSL